MFMPKCTGRDAERLHHRQMIGVQIRSSAPWSMKVRAREAGVDQNQHDVYVLFGHGEE